MRTGTAAFVRLHAFDLELATAHIFPNLRCQNSRDGNYAAHTFIYSLIRWSTLINHYQ